MTGAFLKAIAETQALRDLLREARAMALGLCWLVAVGMAVLWTEPSTELWLKFSATSIALLVAWRALHMVRAINVIMSHENPPTQAKG